MPIHEINLPSSEAVPPEAAGGALFFIGAATVLLRYAGFTILTDPNFLRAGEVAHLGYGLSAKRLTDPAIPIDALPPIDFCLLSHDHGDHFDPIAEERLRKNLPIVTTREAAGALREKGFTEPTALDPWESLTMEKDGARVKVTSMPGRHGPRVVEKLLPTVMGGLLEFPPTPERTTPLRLYISGDTLLFDGLKEIPTRYPEIDLALFHLGGERIIGIPLTMDAGQGVEAVRIIRPREIIPIHYDDYEIFRSPLEDFKLAAEAEGFANRVRYLARGETYRLEAPTGRIERAA